MAAILKQGDQPLTRYYDASGGDVVTGQVLNLDTDPAYDVVIVNNGNDAEGTDTSYALPTGTAVYLVDKDTDFGCVVGGSYIYTAADGELSGATTSGDMSCWVAVADADSADTTVLCVHQYHQAP